MHDHSISTVAILHAQSRETWNRWASHPPTSWIVDRLVDLNAAGVGANLEAHMPRSSVGGGVGQFSAWLTEPSNVAGELDLGTERNVSTFYFELPIPDPDYYDLAYGPQDYQDAPADGSNTFHPSGRVMEDVWEDSILPMLLEVVRQARSPQCPVDGLGERIEAECLTTDFGLVGAKIAASADTKGLLRYSAETRREFLGSGNRRVVFAVQNFSAGTAADTQATVTIRRDGALVESQVVPVALDPGERGVYEVPHAFVPGEYRVAIELDSDDAAMNDRKSFAFDVFSIGVTPVPPYLLMASAKLQVPGLQPSPRRPPWEPPRVDRGTLRFRGRVLGAEVLDEVPEAGLTIVIRPLVHPAVATGEEHPLAWQLPGRGERWLSTGGASGRWVWSDPDGESGPVRHLSLNPVDRPNAPGEHGEAQLFFELGDVDLASLKGAGAYAVELELGDEAVLHALVPGARAELGPREAAEDDPEHEPR